MKTQGFILIDVDAVALNNAGKNTASNFDNAVATKKITKNGRSYTYVSGQAWRYWWRESLKTNFGWNISPITREDKIAFTEANPLDFDDDDIFGYMKAVKEIVKDKNGKDKKENATVTRISPLKNSVIISAGSVRTAENWSSMSRQDGDAVPFSREEYSAVMKGMFSLDLEQVGTFSNYNRSGFKNITNGLKDEAISKGAIEMDDPFNKANKLVRLCPETRLKRASDTINALKYISGGAMQTTNMGDVTPKFIIIVTMKTGNHPFGNTIVNTGINSEIVKLNIDGLKQTIEDYGDKISGNIYIGKCSGFMAEYDDDLNTLQKENNRVKVTSVVKAIEDYTNELKEYIK